jgi:anti-anti-sigma factor
MTLKTDITEYKAGCYIVALDGMLDLNTYDDCEREVLALTDGDIRVLAFDLAQLNYISSTGLRLLFKARKILAEKPARMVLTQPPEGPVAKVFKLTMALPPDDLFPDRTSLESWLDSQE